MGAMHKTRMFSAVFLATLQIFVMIAVAGSLSASGAAPAPAKISPSLLAQLATGQEATFLVILNEAADLSHVATLPSKESRGRAVYDALRAVAQRTQAPLRAELDGLGVEYRPYYIVNMLSVLGDADLAQRLAARPDVAGIEANPVVRVDPPVPEQRRAEASAAEAGIEWGVQRIRADAVWAMGHTGAGITVAGQDTGYDWDHPALQAQYRGWDGGVVSHDYNWHDAIHGDDPNNPFNPPGNPCGFDSPVPCDDAGHGTHTMGTIVGDDGAGNQIGVAPGARWIGCRNMEQGWGTPASYAECFEFFIAPYPIGGDPFTDGDPSRAPHVVNNSWSCPASEGCGTTSLRTIVENVRAAGIVVVVSAGNSGSSCQTIGTPPALHDASFTVGATDSSDVIASFSSRGPVNIDGSNRPKPDVSAPGVSVRSSVPGGGYGVKSGTSMAAPHVAGLVALLWSATPHLIGDVDVTERIVQDAARPRISDACGGDEDGHPNNVYGWGIVDALGAIRGRDVALSLGASVEPRWVDAGSVITYTFAVTNTSVLTPVTDVVLSDTFPLSTTFASASGTYLRVDDQIEWSLGMLMPSQQVSVTLSVTVDPMVPKGTYIVNAAYAVRSSEALTPVIGVPILAPVPWRYRMLILPSNGP